MGETAPNPSLSAEERMDIVVRYLTTFKGTDGEDILGRTVINTDPLETVEAYVARNDHCFYGIQGTMNDIENNPPDSETHRNAIADGMVAMTVYETLLNPA